MQGLLGSHYTLPALASMHSKRPQLTCVRSEADDGRVVWRSMRRVELMGPMWSAFHLSVVGGSLEALDAPHVRANFRRRNKYGSGHLITLGGGRESTSAFIDMDTTSHRLLDTLCICWSVRELLMFEQRR